MHEKMLKKTTVISPERFLRYFLPLENCETVHEVNCNLDSLGYFTTSESMFATITSTLNAEAEICPGYTFALVPSRLPDSLTAVVGGIFPTERAAKPSRRYEGSSSIPANWADIEVCIVSEADVFCDPFRPVDPDSAPDTEDRPMLLELICSCAEKVYESQQRASQFMLLLLSTGARFLWLDRSGVVVTKKFDYRSQPTYLSQFLRRFSRLGPWEWGHDDTAERVAHDSTWGCLMKDIANTSSDDPNVNYALGQFKQSLGGSSPWWCLTVKDELVEGGERRERRFLVGRPHFAANGVFGRGSRGYVALDVDSADTPEPKLVYLKDTWRIIRDDLQEEGATLRILNIIGVPYVPTVLHHGDLDQITPSPEIWGRHHPEATPGTRCPLKMHSHYRLVVREVGRPLEDFNNGKELIAIVFCCVRAHAKAYEAGIIHRDVSAGNMLIYTDDRGYTCGLLNDWELSKLVSDNQRPEEESLDRVGTWQFLSVLAQDDPKKRIGIQDDLESFVHVILYMAIRFLPHNCPNPAALLHNYFDDYQRLGREDYICGTVKRTTINNGYVDLHAQGFAVNAPLEFLLPPEDSPNPKRHPVSNLIDDVLSWHKAKYRLETTRGCTATMPPAETTTMVPQPWGCTVMDDWNGPDEVESDSDGGDVGRKETPWTPRPPHAEDVQRLAKRAKRLDSHAAFLGRLRAIAKEPGWPTGDKGPDKLPVEAYDTANFDLNPSPPRSTPGTAGAVSQELDISEKDGAPLAASDSIMQTSTDVDGLWPSATPEKRTQRG